MIRVLYGAHPHDARIEFRKLELKWERMFDISIVNPFYDLNRNDVLAFDEGRVDRYSANAKEVVSRDLDAIHAAKDGALFYLPDGVRIIGTYQEMVYAYLYGRPVYTIALNGEQDHYWIKVHSTKMFTDVDDFEQFLAENTG